MSKEKYPQPATVFNLEMERTKRTEKKLENNPEIIQTYLHRIFEAIETISPNYQYLKNDNFLDALQNNGFENETAKIIDDFVRINYYEQDAEILAPSSMNFAILLYNNIEKIINIISEEKTHGENSAKIINIKTAEEKLLKKQFEKIFPGENLSEQEEKDISSKLQDAYSSNDQERINLLLKILKKNSDTTKNK